MKTRPQKIGNKLLIGRHEWCQLPDLNLSAIKAKIDTGAKTSAIHAFNIKSFYKKRTKYVNFDIYPIQGNKIVFVNCTKRVFDERYVMSSNGHKEYRFVIQTLLKLADCIWQIELTLSNRDPLRFRMLLGLQALKNRVLIDPNITCNQQKFIASPSFVLITHKSSR